MLRTAMQSLKLLAIISLTLLISPAFAFEEITFRCEGVQEGILDYAGPVDTEGQYQALMDMGALKELHTHSILRVPPFHLKKREKWVQAPDTRVYQIIPGEYIRGPNFEFSFDMCRIYDLAGRLELICTNDKDQEGIAVEGSLLIFQPPFRLRTKQTAAYGFWKQNDRGNWLVADYKYNEFSSGNCEVIDPVPSVDEWFR